MGFLNIFDKVRTARSLTKRSKRKLVAVRVIDIILDQNHPAFNAYGGPDSIGTIFYTIINEETSLEPSKNSPIAKPLFSFMKSYPLKNEVVLILSTVDSGIYDTKGETSYYFPNINVWNHPHHNALPSIRELELDDVKSDYDIDTESGIVSREVTDEGTDINLGNYFHENLKTKPLLPYEGDTIFEGRFGNSIRLGSTNFDDSISIKNPWSLSNTSETGDPIIIIRNGQDIEEDDRGWIHTIENVNRDPSSIYLTSNQSLPNLRVAGVSRASYEAQEEEPETFDPIKFEGLKREKGVTLLEPTIVTQLPVGEEPILTPPTDLSTISEQQTTTLDNVKDEDSDYYDKSETEQEQGEASNNLGDDTNDLNLDELMG